MRALIITISLIGLGIFTTPAAPVAAQYEEQRENCTSGTSAVFLGLPTWYRYLDVSFDNDNGSCDVSPIKDGDGNTDIGATVGAVLLAVTEVLLRIAGIVSVGFIVYGGILYTISQGEPERLGGARKTIINGIIGLVVAVFAVSIVNLLTNVLLS